MLFLFFCSIVCVCFGVLMLALKPAPAAEQVRVRLAALRRTSEVSQEQAHTELEQTRKSRIEDRLLQTRAGRRLADLLLQSRSGRTILAFFAICGAVALVVSTLVGVGYGSAVAGLAAACLGISLYPILLMVRRKRRVERFALQLPAIAGMMARALRAGHSVPQMLELAADQSKDPLRAEFAQLSREQRLGVPLREALLGLSRRMPVPDLRFLVSAILLQKETGGDLIQILERTAALIEERLRIRGKVRTFTAQGRASARVLTALPVVLLLLLSVVMPDYASTLFRDPTGQRMLLAGLVLLILGGLTIRRIVNITV